MANRKDEEIKQLADALIIQASASTAFFFIEDENQNFSFKANKDGLKLLAAELLYASTSNSTSNGWGIANEWYDGSPLELNYIQILDIDRDQLPSVASKPQKWQSLEKIGCTLAFILFIIFLVVGAVTTIKTIAHWI